MRRGCVVNKIASVFDVSSTLAWLVFSYLFILPLVESTRSSHPRASLPKVSFFLSTLAYINKLPFGLIAIQSLCNAVACKACSFVLRRETYIFKRFVSNSLVIFRAVLIEEQHTCR